jgi:hypothetical protein
MDNHFVQAIRNIKQLQGWLNIAHCQARNNMNELAQPAGLIIASSKIAWPIHLIEEELTNRLILRFCGKIGMIAA